MDVFACFMRVEIIRILAGQLVRFAAMAASPFSLDADSWLRIHTIVSICRVTRRSLCYHHSLPLSSAFLCFNQKLVEADASLNVRLSMTQPYVVGGLHELSSSCDSQNTQLLPTFHLSQRARGRPGSDPVAFNASGRPDPVRPVPVL
nr:hypothetical protein [Tanacetum cinerariifolium]